MSRNVCRAVQCGLGLVLNIFYSNLWRFGSDGPPGGARHSLGASHTRVVLLAVWFFGEWVVSVVFWGGRGLPPLFPFHGGELWQGTAQGGRSSATLRSYPPSAPLMLAPFGRSAHPNPKPT